jgi:cytochrome c556
MTMAAHITNSKLSVVILAMAGVVAVAAPTSTVAADERPAVAVDDRIAIRMPPEMRADFRVHMSHHMAALNDVIAAVATGDFRHAAQIARNELETGAGRGFGRYLPIEFREMGLAMHRAASEFAAAAEAVPVPPDPEGWKTVATNLGVISARCQACHATFRVE